MGFKFSTASPKSDIEWRILDAARKPGPGQYQVAKVNQIGGGRFNQSVSKSELEWTIWRAKQIPGPNVFEESAFGTHVPGGVFSTSKLPSDIEKRMHNAKKSPGPGTYDPIWVTDKRSRVSRDTPGKSSNMARRMHSRGQRNMKGGTKRYRRFRKNPSEYYLSAELIPKQLYLPPLITNQRHHRKSKTRALRSRTLQVQNSISFSASPAE